MISPRDDVEALAGVFGLLLEPRDPEDLADRFLRHVVGLVPSEAGLFYLPGEQPPRLSVHGLDRRDGRRLAVELYHDLHGGGRWSERVERIRVDVPWPFSLAAVVGIEPHRRGLLALFSARADAYDPERDGRLLRHMARHAAVAVARARIHRRNREATDRLALQAEELERIRHALERHSREVERSLAARGRYFALMSHELRTPLNAVLGYADLLQQGVLGRLAARQAEAVSKIDASARHLLELVDDVLDLSKIEAGRLAIRHRAIDLRALAAETIAVVEIEAKRKGLELRVRCPESPPVLHSDGALVRQVVLNLLSNAVKFTSAGAVSLDIRHVAADIPAAETVAPPGRPGADGWVAITVEDTGPGIPASQLESIFDEYVQLGAGPRGTGLGLAISRRLARLLGGELVAESEVGVRSRFALFLPCPAPTAESGAVDVVPAPGTTDRRG